MRRVICTLTSIKQNYAMNNTRGKQSKSMLYWSGHWNQRHAHVKCCIVVASHSIFLSLSPFVHSFFSFVVVATIIKMKLKKIPCEYIHAIKSYEQLYCKCLCACACDCVCVCNTITTNKLIFKSVLYCCLWLTLWPFHSVQGIHSNFSPFWKLLCNKRKKKCWKMRPFPMKNRINKFDLLDFLNTNRDFSSSYNHLLALCFLPPKKNERVFHPTKANRLLRPKLFFSVIPIQL